MEDQQTNHPEPSVKTVLAALLLFLPIAAHAQTSVIYDDDCASDNDCGINFATLHQLANEDSIRILATITDSANPLAAPAMKIFNTYNGRPDLLVASNHANTPANPICDKRHCNASSWLPTLIQHYAPTDTAANYPDCLPVYRSTLAAQPDHSVTLISTGFLTCIARLLASPPDKLSPLTGADLIKKKVTKLTVMGGAYPSGSEFNLDADPEDSATVFTTWTTPHGCRAR
jgi:inosine-uridine nucleoside N-ribohydrolase